jgi:hypothetical protein
MRGRERLQPLAHKCAKSRHRAQCRRSCVNAMRALPLGFGRGHVEETGIRMGRWNDDVSAVLWPAVHVSVSPLNWQAGDFKFQPYIIIHACIMHPNASWSCLLPSTPTRSVNGLSSTERPHVDMNT